MKGWDGAPFQFFLSLCKKAFNVLRKQAHLLVTFFVLMRAGHINELDKKCVLRQIGSRSSVLYLIRYSPFIHTSTLRREDIAYLETRLMPEKTDKEAAKAFEDLVFVCLNAKSRLFDDAAHQLNK